MNYNNLQVDQLRKICKARNISQCVGSKYIKKIELIHLLSGITHTINKYETMSVPELRDLAIKKGLIRGSKYITKQVLIEMLTQNTTQRKNPCFDGW